jgi:hypothetical protein
MRRIMNAFSLRPTIVSTFPLSGYQTHNQINFPVMINSVTAVPMLHVRLPVMASTNMGPAVVKFSDSLSQPSFMVENGVFTARNQQVIYSEDVLIFNVPRRTYHPLMNVQNMFKPTNYSNLPQNLVGLEKMNAFPVQPLTPTDMLGNKQTVELVSVVCLNVDKQDTNDELIKGCVTIFDQIEEMTYNPVVVGGQGEVITTGAIVEPTTNGVIFIYKVKSA